MEYAMLEAGRSPVYIHTSSMAKYANMPRWLRCVPVLPNGPRASTPTFRRYRRQLFQDPARTLSPKQSHGWHLSNLAGNPRPHLSQFPRLLFHLRLATFAIAAPNLPSRPVRDVNFKLRVMCNLYPPRHKGVHWLQLCKVLLGGMS